ncbi:hypothetical protein DFJ74DRAFT_764544 [Hyaloraphidium curvatum]|nr:hypothetical protein DFJ74DRAFT_764544 [Hyaloraphidium curvatum]
MRQDILLDPATLRTDFPETGTMRARRRPPDAILLALLLFLCAAGPALAASRKAVPVVDASNADRTLRRGDLLFKYLGETTQISATQFVITNGQKLIREVGEALDDRLRNGDPRSFHVGVYIGGGRVAEAHGGSISTARVGIRTIDAHAGYVFEVLRPKDEKLAAQAADVAEAWAAPGRMKYNLPIAVALKSANFGPKARRAALVYGRAAARRGGPPEVDAMFCSEFGVAVYQAAVVARQLARSPKLTWEDIIMPLGIDIHASNVSPLTAHGRLLEASAKGMWIRAGYVLVRPNRDATGDGSGAADGPAGPDVTSELEVLGNPTEARWPDGESVYARNPWSLRAFQGRIYIGSGNSNDDGPAPNAGPVDLWVYDPAAGKFSSEYEIMDEQVDVIKVLGKQLWIPGHDSRTVGRDASDSEKYTPLEIAKDWAEGNVYRKTASGRWEQLRNIKNGIHVYDVLAQGRTLFAAASAVTGGTVARSSDNGRSWRVMLTYVKPAERSRSLFVLGGKVYCSTSGARIYVFDGKKSMDRVKVSFFPGVADTAKVFAARPTSFGNAVVYIGAKKLIDHDYAPLGLFAAASISQPRRLRLPGGALPRDILATAGKLYVLASTQPDPETTLVQVFSAADAAWKWTEELRFSADTFARSFELLDGYFYFGLGCDPDRLVDSTGRILRVPVPGKSGEGDRLR